MKGVTKRVEIPFQFVSKEKDPSGKMRIPLPGTLTVDRRDFHITHGATVGNEVRITLDIKAIRQG